MAPGPTASPPRTDSAVFVALRLSAESKHLRVKDRTSLFRLQVQKSHSANVPFKAGPAIQQHHLKGHIVPSACAPTGLCSSTVNVQHGIGHGVFLQEKEMR